MDIKTTLKYISLFILFFLHENYYSQGTTCAGATSITVNGGCTSSATISDATINGNSTVCGGTVSREAWYIFTSTGSTATITATGNNRNVAIELLSACGGSVVGCDNTTNVNGTDTETLTVSGLTNGTNYIIRIVNVGTNDLTLTSLCVTGPVVAPSNDNCSGATAFPTIAADGSCSTLSNQTTAGATNSGVTPTGACSSNSGTPDDDVWYSFVAPTASVVLTATNVSGNTDVYWQVFSGSCGSSMTSLLCTDNNSGGTITGLTTGQTYYVRLYTWGSGVSSVQNICLAAVPDPCSTTTNIASCGTTTTTATIPSGNGSYGTSSCGFTTGGKELIYTFTPSSSGTYSIQQLSSFAFIDYQYRTVASGCGSSGWTCIDDISGAGTSPGFSLVGGTQYYFLLDPESTAGGNLSFVISCPPTPPSNDNCSGAISVSVNSNTLCASTTTGTSVGGTQSQVACSGTADDDVWYSFTATATTHSITVTPGTMSNANFEVFSGTCGALTSYSCVNNTTGASAESSLISGLSIGSTYFVRVHSNGNATGNGTFSVCINVPAPPPANDECTGAYTLTVNSGTTCTSLTDGTLLNSTASAQTTTCDATYDDDDVWYSFVATSSTHTLALSNVAGNNTDLYHSVYSGSCGSIGDPIICRDANSGALTGLTVGNTYFVRVYTWGTTTGANTTFSVCVTTPPPPPSNDDPTGATPITPGATCSYTTFTNANATATSCGTIAVPGCASYSGGDVWFSLVVPASGGFILDSQTGVITDGGMAVYSGTPCGAMNLISCDDDNSANGAMPSLTVAATAGSTVYIRFWEYSNDNNGTFGLCATNYTPPAAPANDNPCGATVVSVNSGSTCTSQANGNVVGATSSTVSLGSCFGNPDDDVWFSFVATSTTHSVNINNVAGSVTDMYHSVHPGPCGSIGAALVCSDANASVVSGLTIGNTYYIRVYTYTSGPQTTTFSVCVTTPPPPPANDECSGAYTVAVNSGTTCTSQTGGTLVGATSSFSNSCYGTADDDVWYSFTATSTTHSLSINNIAGSTTDLYHSVFAGTCGSIGEPFICNDNNSSMIGGLTVGNVYYVRIFSYTSTFGQTTTFSVCVTTPTVATPPSNNNCSGATTVATNSGITCSTLAGGTLVGATSSTIANTCGGGTADDDVWYSFVATSTSHSVTLNNIAGSTTDLYHSVYGGSCASVGAPLICSDPNTSAIYGLTIGNTYYIRVFSYTGTFGQTTTFSVCVTTPPPTGPCGNPTSNDYCSNPATLTQGVGTFSSSTSAIYSSDQPGNLSSEFCGSIENNSWYYFVATSTTESFPITSVSGCSSSGIQAEVYAVSQSSIGCCTSFTSMSNCFNPGTVSTGTVTATGLTIGQTYILMVDGYGGAVCDFVFANWTATGILPIQLITFVGKNEGNKNKIEWVSASEQNSDYFILEKSNNGIDFNDLIKISAAGNSSAPKNYSAFDMSPFEEITYYRLKKVDLDESYEYSNIISVNNSNLTSYISNIRPNPTDGIINYDINCKNSDRVNIEIINEFGVVIEQELIKTESGLSTYSISLDKFESGIYLLKATFGSNGKTEISKIIKN